MAIRIKNTSGADGLWVGQLIADGEYYDLPMSDRSEWTDDPDVFADISSGNLVVNDGVNDIIETLKGWRHLEGTLAFPVSDLDNQKLAVHTSYKPRVPGITTYAVWTGAGDDIAGGNLGDGDLLHFDMTAGNPITSKDIKFDHASFGRIWLHEAYMKFTGAGDGDFITSNIMAEATTLQTSLNLDLVIDGDDIKFAPGGPGTGTHGFAANPVLIPRSFSNDGDWDYDGTNLTPNVAGTGKYKIKTVETPVHRFVNKIPCYGDCASYFSMTSDETAELNPGYFIRAEVHNNSNGNWHLSVMLEIYRERTVDP